MVERVTDTRGIESAPIGRILDEARNKTESRHGELRDFRPFEGLVVAQPFRALAALRFALRNDDVPTGFWEALLSNWPEETPQVALARRPYRLPASKRCFGSDEILCSQMVPKHLILVSTKPGAAHLTEADRPRALAILDKVIAIYVAMPPELTKSGIGHTSVGGVVQDRSEVSINKAINSPIGVLAEVLSRLMPDTATEQGTMPDGLGERFEALFEANGDGGGHAACVVARHFPWIDHCFPEWTHRVLRPMFSIDHPLSEAVWHGFAQSREWPTTKTLKMLCPHLLALLKGEPVWGWINLKSSIWFKRWWFSPDLRRTAAL
ncbi:hypothetical protein E6W36_10265 [Hankyongella ginsenosidimutans]|uniref:Uncharacterized protein n=1 Tax=Hankyongella ginsenosidimutans TaxID=1763828 RepID=A0A4D7CC65_9SPHN|nr:hypothetical protein [Hankyongella ginsenosidimutans]QCI79782.1 hypothetical protein E6W36_10265 [Hankyongella ginsenosidimutans]